MRVICKYSGVEFQSSNFSNITVISQHPLFGQDTKILLSKAPDYFAGRLNAHERRILFLSLLHSTELVEEKMWKKPAKPSDEIIQNNMELLIRIVNWKHALPAALLNLPRITIDNDPKMYSIGNWLAILLDRKKAWDNNYYSSDAAEKSQIREEALEKLIRSPTRNATQFNTILLNWAFETSNYQTKSGKKFFDLNPDILEYWKVLFRLKGYDIYNARSIDLEELHDHMQDHLDHYNKGIFAKSVMDHCRLLVEKNSKGLLAELGVGDDFQLLDPSDNIQMINEKSVAAMAPQIQPSINQFKSNVEYLLAKARWNIAQKHKAEIAEFEQKQEVAISQDVSDNMDVELEQEQDNPEKLEEDFLKTLGMEE